MYGSWLTDVILIHKKGVGPDIYNIEERQIKKAKATAEARPKPQTYPLLVPEGNHTMLVDDVITITQHARVHEKRRDSCLAGFRTISASALHRIQFILNPV